MDITTLASRIYSTGPDLAGGALQEQLETLSREEFVQLMTQTNRQRLDRAETPKECLYAGSTQRAKLSDAEIAALANKYDPHNMDRTEYGDFLNDLVDMGAISKWEKLLMGYNGMMEIDYVHAGGQVTPEDSELPGSIAEMDGNVLSWLRTMLAQRDSGAVSAADRAAMEQNWERYEAVAGILQRMEAVRQDQSREDEERADLIRQLADSNSDFYTGILQKLQQNMEEREDQEREQAIIDALGGVLDAMSGREDAKRSDIPLSMAEIDRQIGALDPQDPERVRWELFLQRLNELGIYFDPADFTGGREEESQFETLSQFLLRRQTGKANSSEKV